MHICGRAPAMAVRLSSSRIPLLEHSDFTGNQTLFFFLKFLLKFFYLNKVLTVRALDPLF